MSTLKGRLQTDLTVHLKAREELPTTTLRNVLGEIQLQEKAGKTSVEFSDADILALLGREVKKRNKVVEEYSKAAEQTTDTARVETLRTRIARELAEVEFLNQYLPVGLSADALEAIVDKAIADVETKDFGKVMRLVAPQTKGLADGKTVSDLVRSKLA